MAGVGRPPKGKAMSIPNTNTSPAEVGNVSINNEQTCPKPEENKPIHGAITGPKGA